MTPRERAEKIEQDHPHHIPQRHKLIEAITQAIKDALAAEAAERLLLGAPLTEERWQHILERNRDHDGSMCVSDRRRLVGDRIFLLALIADLGEDDPGKMAQWQSGRLFGINEGLEEAIKKIEEVCLAGAKDQLAASIRALKRPTL